MDSLRKLRLITSTMSKKRKTAIEKESFLSDIKESKRNFSYLLEGWYWLQGITDVLSISCKSSQEGAPNKI